MKTLFVLPYQSVRNLHGLRDRPSVSLPLGVLGIAAYLQEHGWKGEMAVYDCCLSGKVERRSGVTYFGDSPDEIHIRLRNEMPRVVGISTMFSWQASCALEVAAIARSACPESVVVMGGPHASAFPLETVSDPNIDYVVMGEGEERMLALLQALEAGERPMIPGVLGGQEDMRLLRPNAKAPISFIQSLDDLPFPAYDLVDLERYFYLQRRGFSPRAKAGGKRAVPMLTSRGCPHQCVFCSIQTTMGYRFRPHSPAYVGAHIEMLMERYDVDYIHFEDDSFTHDPVRYDEVVAILSELGPAIRWDTPNGVRGDSWTLERVRSARDAGCQFLIVSVESGVQRVLDTVVKKRLDLNKVDEVMRNCREVGLPLFAYYVLGLPGERLEDIEATVDYALRRFRQFDVIPTFNLAIPLPGTELFDIVVSDGLHRGALMHQANEIWTDGFDPASVKRIYDRALGRLFVMALGKALTQPSFLRRLAVLACRHRYHLAQHLRAGLRGLRGSGAK